MKLMKKLSALIALCLCLTVGGVYATWVYSEKTDVMDLAPYLTVGLTEATATGTYGSYHVDSSGLTMSIDPVSDGSHEAALKITGSLIITFEPNKYAPTEVRNGGIPTTVTFGTSVDQANWKYGTTRIFTVDTTPIDVTWGTPNADGDFVYEIDAATLADYFTLTSGIVLDTKTDYDAFNTALGQGKLQVTVSDGETSTPTT